MRKSEHPDSSPNDDPFGSTRWSVVLAAGAEGLKAEAALATLCESYWLPVYGYVRSRTRNVDDAFDLTQSFFADLLERRTMAAADPARGRFRAFLLTSLKNFMVNQHQRSVAQKRGGGRVIVSFDPDAAESRLASSEKSTRTPEQEFERRWSLALLDCVLERLTEEQTLAGREREFAALRPFLCGEQQQVSQVDVSKTLGASPEAVRAAIYRLRKRYRTLLREEVAQTVGSPEEVDEELDRLISVVSS